MKKTILLAMTAFGLLFSSCQGSGEPVNLTEKVYNQGINIIPLPKDVKELAGHEPFVLTASTKFLAEGEEATKIANFLVAKLNRATGYKLQVEAYTQGVAKGIILRIEAGHQGLGSEGYTLKSTAEGVEIIGASAQGLFWGVQSLLQLLPAEVESSKVVNATAWTLPAVEIVDEPAFGYRGMLIDVCRHFATVEEMKAHIDLLSLFKINRLHWHLTEDQGWRIEIKKYPKLTEIGATRTEIDGTEYGPYFYTQEQVKEIVAYASERFVTIIPEIELPGHAMGAIAAYPELSCFPKTQKGSDYSVRTIWGIEIDVYCPGKEHTFAFLQDVIDEVAPLFPSEYFHIGGDECPKDRWKVCPDCQKRIKSEGLKNEYELQSYTIRRAQDMLAKHGKKLIGWDEILEGGLAPSATVMSWRGENGGIESANQGHDVIMTPGSGGLYIDHYQGDPKAEPLAIFGYAPLEKTYSYHPIPVSIAEDKRHHILGAQANLWAEYVYTDSIRQYMAYPRVIALAELAWTPKEKKNFADFSKRLENAQVRLDQHGTRYHIPLPEQPKGSRNFEAFVDSTLLELKTTRPIKIVYTTDGSEPTATSIEYTQPIVIKENTIVKTATVLTSGKLSPVRTIKYEKQELAPAEELAGVELGLKTQTSVGNYMNVADFANATNWVAGKIEKIEQVRPNGLVNNFDEFERKAVIAEGYIKIPEDGVYFFSTNNEEFWIDGVKLIDNANTVKKFSHQDGSRALKAGYHPIKVVFVGSSHGGYPNYWDDAKVLIRSAKAEKFEPITEAFVAK